MARRSVQNSEATAFPVVPKRRDGSRAVVPPIRVADYVVTLALEIRSRDVHRYSTSSPIFLASRRHITQSTVSLTIAVNR